jgi:hypothetical protein
MVKIYSQYAYIAGVKVPIISSVINSNFGSLASLSVAINYSPYITHIYEYAKIQLWEQLTTDGVVQEPTLEFDGVIIGIQRRRNLLGEVSVSLSCLTDGAVWNIRKQSDFYLSDILAADYRGTGNILNMRADGQITNYFAETLKQNQFDIGCCIASVLTSYVHSQPNPNKPTKEDEKSSPIISYYQYSFNGKEYEKRVLPSGGQDSPNIASNPTFYNKFLDEYKLANKVYGVSTSNSIKEYFKQESFLNLITNKQNDVYGENTFWQLAMTVAQYGFFNVYDIPNPTFIDTDNGTGLINVETLLPSDKLTNLAKDEKGNIIPLSIDCKPEVVTVVSPTSINGFKYKKTYKGLAEYIFKPISIMGIPFKCNVIWPDQVQEESIFYDFFNTPTRILYQRSPIPGIEKTILTSQIVVGPDFSNENGYLKSMTLSHMDANTLRDADIYTDYEAEYGIKYHRLNLSLAFDNALLNNVKTASMNDSNAKIAFSKINNYLNYEFAQKFLGTRQYTISVTPDCNPVAGFPLVVLNKMGEHVISFCTGVRKSWSATGQKSVSLNVAYPRYYFEDFGDLGNIIDTISQDQNSLDEVSMLIGSKPLGILSAEIKNHMVVKQTIKDMFEQFQNAEPDARETLKNDYRRKICTYKQFMNLHDKEIADTDSKDMPPEYPLDKFDSSEAANNLSCHYFEVYDSINNRYEEFQGIYCSDILKSHLIWIKEPKRI